MTKNHKSHFTCLKSNYGIFAVAIPHNIANHERHRTRLDKVCLLETTQRSINRFILPLIGILVKDQHLSATAVENLWKSHRISGFDFDQRNRKISTFPLDSGIRVSPVLPSSQVRSVPTVAQAVKKLLSKLYRGENKGLYMVVRNCFLLLLNFSAWPCLGAA